ncbi:Protein of unknown function [Pseudomonas extremaustralis]|jgi:hypothetical protein|uniref:DUF1120 domain-containing protein n=2 Tax=Pseudomonas extremaustralis TaxID=359110 RepID=A0ABY0NK99_9PSED|nr:Protein of unknown function [Pseudomonas extremaustralis]
MAFPFRPAPLLQPVIPMNLQPIALAALLTSFLATPAWSASIVDVTVTGRLTPDACHVELSEEGIVDHGKIPTHVLNGDEFTVLPSLLLELSVQCTRPMLFALVGIDNRSASALAPGVYGLGTNLHAPDERLGSVALSYRNPIGDAQPMQVLTSLDNGETWTPRPNAEPKVFAGFALPGDRQPDFIRQLTTQLQVETTLNVANDLTLNQEVPLDGSIVLDLRYL